jgi:hypothetical protein
VQLFKKFAFLDESVPGSAAFAGLRKVLGKSYPVHHHWSSSSMAALIIIQAAASIVAARNRNGSVTASSYSSAVTPLASPNTEAALAVLVRVLVCACTISVGV